MTNEWLLAIGLGGCFFALAFFRLATSSKRIDPTTELTRSGVLLRSEKKYDLEIANFDGMFQKMIDQCHWRLNPSEVALAIFCLGTIAMAIAYVAVENGWVAIGSGVGVVSIALLALLIRAKIVRSNVEEQLPSAIEMLAGTMRAGVSLEQGLASVGSKGTGFLAKDLNDCARRIDLGLPASVALGEIANRYDLLDLRLLAAVVSTHRQTGGDLAGVMDQLSQVARGRLAFRRQLSSMTITARLAAFIVGLAAPALLGYYTLRGFEFDRLWEDPQGRFFLGLALGLELLGIVWVIGLTRKVM